MVLSLLYPLKFTPIYKSYLWGGRNIERKLRRKIPDGMIAESWEISCRDDGMSVVSNGTLKGESLLDIIRSYKEKLLGTIYGNHPEKAFPLLIKIIDANDRLSVQVHPNDSYAKENGEIYGKTEMWYIIDAKPDAKLIYGFKNRISREEFLDAVKSNNLNGMLNEVPALPGDVFYIPSGTVHALLDGLLVAEVQQNSNTTYRISDWDRVDSSGKPRDLHIDKAMEVINFDFQPTRLIQTEVHDNGNYDSKTLVKCDYFCVDEIKTYIKYRDMTDNTKFNIYMIFEGEGSIKYDGGTEDVFAGDTVLIPASLGSYEITGNIKMLRVY